MPDRKDNITAISKERKEELMQSCEKFIQLAEEQLATGPKELSKEARDMIFGYDWSEDGLELEMAVKRACVMSRGSVVEVEDFDLECRQAKSIGQFVEAKLKGFMHNIKGFENFNLFDMVIPEVERSLILMVLKETNGNQIRASKLLGINRNTLRTKIKKLGIKVNKK